MDTVALLQDGRTFVPARYVAEAFGATVKWDSAVRTVYVKTGTTPNENNGDRVTLAGFVVPKGTKLTVSDEITDESNETSLVVNFLKNDVEGQKDDLEKILLQRLNESTVKQIMEHIRPKKKASDFLTKKVVFDTNINQYIGVSESKAGARTIAIWILRPGMKPAGY